jgi:hypothetical protein
VAAVARNCLPVHQSANLLLVLFCDGLNILVMTEMEVTGQMKQQARQGKNNAQRYRYMPIPMSILSPAPLDSHSASRSSLFVVDDVDEPLEKILHQSRFDPCSA